MTDIGYKFLMEEIVNRTVDVPDDMTTFELQAWLNGYTTCQVDILEIIKKSAEGQKE